MKTYTAIVMLALLTLFCGCKQSDGKYGNFAQAEGIELVQDSLTVMSAAYPPAKTRLSMLQPMDDAFGVCLVESLRANGYAVAEYVPRSDAKGDGQPPPANPADGRGFAYVVDRDAEGLRVTLHVGYETLSRLYLIREGEGEASYLPNGCWVRKQ